MGQARLLARWALAAAAATVVLLLTGLGAGGLLILFSGLVGIACSAVGIWWFLAHRGAVRFLGALLAVGAPLAVLSLYIIGGLWLTALLALGLWGVALLCGRGALRRLRDLREGGRGERTDLARGERRPRPRRPVLIMNPRSGGGKVARFGLVERAEKLGARVVLLDESAQTDVTALAQQAVADGADLLGVAGGDGTQALVAAVAAEHDLPFLVISAGTRNHFALDLGLDRADPSTCLDALVDGEELRVDLGSVSGRAFVNTVSFGVYADVVQHPEYRDAKAGTALELLPDLLQGGEGDRLDALADDVRLPAQQAILVSNNPYAAPDPFGAATARRPRLDGGRLGVIGVRVDGAAQAAELAVRGTQSTGLNVLTATRVEVTGKAVIGGTGGTGGPGGPGGVTGTAGATRATGATGPTGAAAGPTRPTGPTGPTGAAGAGESGGAGEAARTPSAGEAARTRGAGASGEAGAPAPAPGCPAPGSLDPGSIAVAVDGEALILPTPVVCTLRPGALRVLVPRDRPGASDPVPPMNWRRVIEIAFHHPSHPYPRSGA
ncbi:diacylglycerol kinase family protein [Streptomyces lateritius]|uniref:diacylglycerol/lipid kinase family protein n=1 Tax=Streptomyces lateritius TaxID=67313 RepID=UPI002892E583|nr:diacylglycerol kinase family protein [Streptomyces lateritius]